MLEYSTYSLLSRRTKGVGVGVVQKKGVAASGEWGVGSGAHRDLNIHSWRQFFVEDGREKSLRCVYVAHFGAL